MTSRDPKQGDPRTDGFLSRPHPWFFGPERASRPPPYPATYTLSIDLVYCVRI